jgi:TP901 family phage tail tape measure protein
MAQGARYAEIRFRVNKQTLNASLGDADRRAKTWARKTGVDMNKAMRGGFGGLASVLGVAGGAAGVVAVGKQVLEFETQISRLGIASRSSAQKMSQLKAQIFAIARSRGVDANQLLGSVEKFVAATGDIDAAIASMDGFGKTAAATGAEVEDLAITASALSTNMKVAGKDMEQAFGVLLSQGKAGAVELKDMASILTGLTPQFASFNKTGIEGLTELGALLQLAKTGFATASEAGTGLSSLMTAFLQKSKDLKKLGVEVFEIGPDGQKRLRAVSDIAFELIEKSKGNPQVLQKALGRQEAFQAILALMNRGRGEFDKLVAAGGSGLAELEKDFAKFAETPAAKLASVKAQFEQTFNESLVRVLPIVASAMEKIAQAVEWMSKHPEVLAAIAAVKLGSMGSGLAGRLGAGNVAGWAMGAAGGAGGAGGKLGGLSMMPGAGRGARLLGGASSLAQGAAIGYMVTETIGQDLPAFSKGVLGAAHALAMLPGPIGLVGKAAAGLSDVVLLATNHLEKRVEKRQQAIASAEARDLVDVGKRANLPGAGTIWKEGRNSGGGLQMKDTGKLSATFDERASASLALMQGLSPEQRDASQVFLSRAFDRGIISKVGDGANASFPLDESALDKYLASDKSISDTQREQIRRNTLTSHALLSMDPETRERFMQRANPKQKGPAVFGQGKLAPWAGVEGEDGSPFVFGQDTPEAATMPSSTYRSPRESRVQVDVKVTAGPGIKAEVENDPKQLRR